MFLLPCLSPLLAPNHIRRTIVLLLQGTTCVSHLFQIHAFVIKSSLQQNIFIAAKFLRQCLSVSSSELLPYARSIFDRIRSPDAFIWNTLIRAYLCSENPEECIKLFDRMRLEDGVIVDSFSLSLAVQACGKTKDELSGRRIHAHVVKLGYVCDLFVQTALVEMYAKVGNIETSRLVFSEMPEPDLVSYNVLLAEYVKLGQIEAAHGLYDVMPEKDLVSRNTLIYGYASIGNATAARQLFDISSCRDLVSWSSMIVAYTKSGQPQDALKLFHEMQSTHLVPDAVIMVSVLSACGDLGALGIGKMVHEFIRRRGIEVDVKLGTSLIDMYANCGDIESSLKVLDGMRKKDVLTWNSVIMGLANHGYEESALNLFCEMVSSGLKPNEITFVGVLRACSHIGFVSEGWEIFRTMSNIYGILPKIEHYGCMIDLLGRSGHLREAKELIYSMPFAPDAIVWRALLGACKIHKNIKLAEEALSNLVELEPHVDGHYVLLSNIYAEAKQWDGVVKMRRMMRSLNLSRVPGCSSIEVDNMVHEFIAGDKSHPMTQEIHAKLAEMTKLMYLAGYRPTISSFIWNLDKQKEKEKAALDIL